MPGPANTFSGSPLDRAGGRRADEHWLRSLRQDRASRAVGVTPDGVLVDEGDEPRLARLPLAAFDEVPLLLGIEPNGAALFAVDASGLEEPPPGTVSARLRDAGAVLPHDEGGVLAQAAGLVNWHRRHPRCSVCGAETDV